MRRAILFLLVATLVVNGFPIPALAAQASQPVDVTEVVEAADPRATTVIRGLDINGSVATCTLRVTGNSMSEYMVATIKLYRGSLCVATWGAVGNGYISFSQNKSVMTGGYTYTLRIQLTIDGKDFPIPDISKSC